MHLPVKNYVLLSYNVNSYPFVVFVKTILFIFVRSIDRINSINHYLEFNLQ